MFRFSDDDGTLTSCTFDFDAFLRTSDDGDSGFSGLVANFHFGAVVSGDPTIS